MFNFSAAVFILSGNSLTEIMKNLFPEKQGGLHHILPGFCIIVIQQKTRKIKTENNQIN